MSQEISWLALTLAATALFSFPYVLNRIAVRGLWGTMANPSPEDKPLAAWAQRAQRAHANAIENLAVFAPAVIVLQFSGKAGSLTAAACAVYFAARMVHYGAYAAGIPVLRTLCFFAGWGATMVVAGRAIGWF